MIRTITTGNKRRGTPLFAVVYGDGRGHNYRYENWPTRLRRREVELLRRDWPLDPEQRPLYRINVYPRKNSP
jgi:hypothetical protein